MTAATVALLSIMTAEICKSAGCPAGRGTLAAEKHVSAIRSSGQGDAKTAPWHSSASDQSRSAGGVGNLFVDVQR